MVLAAVWKIYLLVLLGTGCRLSVPAVWAGYGLCDVSWTL